MRAAAIFDIDGTLLPRPSTEVRFVRYLLRRRVLRPHDLWRWLWSWRGWIEGGSPPEAERAYLRGLDVGHVQESVDAFFQRSVLPDLRPKALARLRAHEAAGHLIVLLSGTLDFLLVPFQILLRAHVGIGTRLEERDGAFTGRVIGRNFSGKEKARGLVDLQKAYGIDLGLSYGYGDHYADRYFLQMVGHPVAINPDRRLKAQARAANWRIEDWAG